jgi:hypothetical protein
MPTAAKLVAALCFALLGFVTAVVLRGTLPASQPEGFMYPVAIGAGAICGWMVSGSAKRAGYIEAAGTGLRTAVISVVTALGTLSLGTMWQTAMAGRYRGPMDAVLDVINEFIDFGSMLGSGPVIGTLLIGGILAGMVTENAGRRWR